MNSPQFRDVTLWGRLAVWVAWFSSDEEDALMTVVAMSHGELSRYDKLLRVTRQELRDADTKSLLDGIISPPPLF